MSLSRPFLPLVDIKVTFLWSSRPLYLHNFKEQWTVYPHFLWMNGLGLDVDAWMRPCYNINQSWKHIYENQSPAENPVLSHSTAISKHCLNCSYVLWITGNLPKPRHAADFGNGSWSLRKDKLMPDDNPQGGIVEKPVKSCIIPDYSARHC